MKIAIIASATPEALAAQKQLEKKHTFYAVDKADVWLVLGGDGTMLETLHRAKGTQRKVYGMNCGTVGFLMNHFDALNLEERISQAREHHLSPLEMCAQTDQGDINHIAFNEVSLLRQTRQAAHLRIAVNDKERLSSLVCDGVMVATPAGSTAYNTSVGGPILPLGAPLLTLTPISAFRPRRWRGAILPQKSAITFTVDGAQKRPVSAVADFKEVRNIQSVTIRQATDTTATALFDREHHLEERILLEQFSTS